MTTNGSDLASIEFRLRKGLEEHARAETRGDLYENVFRIHTPLEDALNYLLRDEPEEVSFPQKFEKCLSEIYQAYPVEELNKQRNYLAHPKQPFTDEYVRDTAFGLAELAAASWPGLFGHAGPTVTHPDLLVRGQEEPPAAPDDYYTSYSEQTTQPRGSRSCASIALYVLLGIVLMACVTAAAFVFARRLASTAPPVTPTAVVVQPSRGLAPGEIAVGSRVRVTVPEGKTLLTRAQPGANQAPVARFTSGTYLTVIGGPQITPDGVTWWEVEREPGTSGWCAAGWLRPAE